jgi:UDP-glucose 4-epimerase
MRVLITGGQGFIGSHLAHSLVSTGNEVITYDACLNYFDDKSYVYLSNLKFRKHLLKNVKTIFGNVNDFNSTMIMVRDFHPDCVVHLANLPLVNISIRRPREAFEGIFQSTFNLLEVLKEVPSRLIYASSSMVYGNFENDPISEGDRKDPVEIYGSMKLSGEIICNAYSRLYGFPLTIVRPSAVYGFSDCNQRVVQNFIEAAIFNNPIKVKNPDSTFLDFTYIKDVVEGLSLIIANEKTTGIFNITRGESRSLRDLVNAIRLYYPNVEVEEIIEEGGYRPKRGTLNTFKARNELGYKPIHSLESGIEEYIWLAERWWKPC